VNAKLGDMNQNTEQDVVKPLSSVDTEIKASRQKLDRDFEQFWADEDAKQGSSRLRAVKVVAEPEPVHEPAVNAEVLAERDRLRAENERLKAIEREVDITSDPDFQKTYIQPIAQVYGDWIQETAQYFDAEPERIQKEFVQPLWNEWTPETIQAQDPDWVDTQLNLAVKAPGVTKAKLKQKFEEAVHLQKKHDAALAEWRKPENVESRRQHRQQQEQQRTTTDLVAREIAKAVNEPEFAYYGNLTKRAESGDAQAKAEVAAINQDFPGWIDLQLRLGEPPGTAVRNALRKLPKKGGVTQANKAAAMSGSQGALGQKPLPRDGAKSLRDAFSQNWDSKGKPPIRYNSLTSKYE
jgi:hypothetical protein